MIELARLPLLNSNVKVLTIFLLVIGLIFADSDGDGLLDAANVYARLVRHRGEVALSRLKHVSDAQLEKCHNHYYCLHTYTLTCYF